MSLIHHVCRLDGKHVVFGKVTEGIDILAKIEAQGSQNGKPKSEVNFSFDLFFIKKICKINSLQVKIIECGEV